MLCFENISGNELVALSSVIAILIAKDLTAEQQNTLGNFLMTIGQNVVTIAGQQAIAESQPNAEIAR